MNLEQKSILLILKDHLYNRPTIMLDETVDWEVLFDIAKKHEIESIIYKQCLDLIPKEIAADFESSYSATMFFYANQRRGEHSITSSLQSHKIPYFLLKGNVIANYYPIPALRTKGDVDIVVRPEDKNNANKILIGLGYTPPIFFEKDTEWVYTNGAMHVELHDRVIYKRNNLSEETISFFKNIWTYVDDNKLDANSHFLFVLLHIYKHFKSGGVGIRQFFDIAVLTRFCNKLDFKWIEEKLKACNLYDFATIVFNINKNWFDVNPPIHVEDVSHAQYEEVSNYIFINGVFGRENEYADIDNTINKMAMGNSRFKLLINIIFPSYNYLATSDEYAFLRGKKYLLPVAWIYRVCYSITKGNTKQVVRNIFSSIFSKSKYNDRIEFLSKSGIKNIKKRG